MNLMIDRWQIIHTQHVLKDRQIETKCGVMTLWTQRSCSVRMENHLRTRNSHILDIDKKEHQWSDATNLDDYLIGIVDSIGRHWELCERLTLIVLIAVGAFPNRISSNSVRMIITTFSTSFFVLAIFKIMAKSLRLRKFVTDYRSFKEKLKKFFLLATTKDGVVRTFSFHHFVVTIIWRIASRHCSPNERVTSGSRPHLLETIRFASLFSWKTQRTLSKKSVDVWRMKWHELNTVRCVIVQHKNQNIVSLMEKYKGWGSIRAENGPYEKRIHVHSKHCQTAWDSNWQQKKKSIPCQSMRPSSNTLSSEIIEKSSIWSSRVTYSHLRRRPTGLGNTQTGVVLRGKQE